MGRTTHINHAIYFVVDKNNEGAIPSHEDHLLAQFQRLSASTPISKVPVLRRKHRGYMKRGHHSRESSQWQLQEDRPAPRTVCCRRDGGASPFCYFSFAPEPCAAGRRTSSRNRLFARRTLLLLLSFLPRPRQKACALILLSGGKRHLSSRFCQESPSNLILVQITRASGQGIRNM